MGAGKLVFQDTTAGSATRMVIDGAGNVGIGTPAPAFPLDVTGAIRGDGANLTNLNPANLAAGTLNPSVLLGQCAASVFSTGTLTIAPSTGFTTIPGLSQFVTVPANSVVYISADGGASTTSTASAGFSAVDIAILIDGSVPLGGGYKRVTVLNNAGLAPNSANWSMALSIPLSAGNHTIQVDAKGAGAGATATVAGDISSVLRAQLTVVILKN